LSRRPLVRFCDTHHPGEVHAGEAGKSACLGNCLFLIDLSGHDATGLGAFFAQNARQLARIDAGDGHEAVLLQIVGQSLLQAPALGANRQVTNYQPGGMVAARFEVLVIAADVADVRIGERDNLTAVGGIGQYLLVAGHRRIEHHLAAGTASGADSQATENRAIGQCENRGRKSG
jgi:hypothetical protein